MRTRIWIGIVIVAGLLGAVYAEELAGAYVVIAGSAIISLLHRIEVKLTTLLVHHSIRMPTTALGAPERLRVATRAGVVWAASLLRRAYVRQSAQRRAL